MLEQEMKKKIKTMRVREQSSAKGRTWERDRDINEWEWGSKKLFKDEKKNKECRYQIPWIWKTGLSLGHKVYGSICETANAIEAHRAWHIFFPHQVISQCWSMVVVFFPLGTPGQCISPLADLDFRGEERAQAWKCSDIYRGEVVMWRLGVEVAQQVVGRHGSSSSLFK